MLPSPRTIFENNWTLISVSENRKTSLKFRSSANSHQKGALSPPNFTEHLMNIFGQAQSRIWKQSSVSCKKPKLNYFWNRCSFATRLVLYLRNPLTFHERSERAQVRYSKASKRLSSQSEDKEILSENVILSQFTRKMYFLNFPYSTWKLMWKFQWVQRITFEKKKALASLSRKKQCFPKTSFDCKNKPKNACNPWNTKLN